MTSQIHIKIPISGMTCASCALHVEEALKEVEGAKEIYVNLADNSASLLLDKEKIGQAIEKINSAGYDVPLQTATLKISGMTCASCALRIEKALQGIEGVVSASVNLTTEKAKVSFLPQVNLRQIIKAIESEGYRATVESSLEGEKAREKERASLRLRLIVGASLSILVLVGSLASQFSAIKLEEMPYILFMLATPVQFWVGLPFYRGAWGALRHGTSDMNTLVVLGTSAAYLYSTFTTFFPSIVRSFGIEPVVYFDTSAVIITLVLLGKYFEALAKGRTSLALRRLLDLQPPKATIIKNGAEEVLPLEEVKVGDVLIVRPGEKVPVDGIILEGYSYIDESLVTGESIPVFRKAGDKVIGGSLNTTGSFRMHAEKVGEETFLAEVVKMVEEAQSKKAPVQKLADKVAAIFVPTVLSIALVTFMVWFILGPQPTFLLSLNNAIAVLVIACPCALGLATPTAVMVGMGKGAELGILIRSSEVLEKTVNIKKILFDKTGTLTKGKPHLERVIALKGSEGELLRLASLAEKKSEHPIAQAILEAFPPEEKEPDDFQAIPGKGVMVKVENQTIYLGSSALMKELNIDNKSLLSLEEEGFTVLYLALNDELWGALLVRDEPKPEAKEVISLLRAKGFDILMITGDSWPVARAIAQEIGIDEVIAETLPQEKAVKIRELQQSGFKVAMVGDGINDAPSLAQADLGIALGTGTDIALETADIALVSPNLKGVVRALDLARHTFSTIRWNLFWAFFYNVLGIPIAAGALYPVFGLLLNPMLAALAMAFSSLFVVGNSLRLGALKL